MSSQKSLINIHDKGGNDNNKDNHNKGNNNDNNNNDDDDSSSSNLEEKLRSKKLEISNLEMEIKKFESSRRVSRKKCNLALDDALLFTIEQEFLCQRILTIGVCLFRH